MHIANVTHMSKLSLGPDTVANAGLSQEEYVVMVSYKNAIGAKCKWCIFDSREPGNWREQVTMCTATDCPLWHCRPKVRRLTEKQQKKLLHLMQASEVDPEVTERC